MNSDTPKTPDDELDKILDAAMRGVDYRNFTAKKNEVLAKLKARERRIRLQTAKDIRKAMPPNSDAELFVLRWFEKEFKEQFKHDSMPDETKGGEK